MANGSGGTVLHVEDDPGVIEGVERALERETIEVVTEPDPRSALARADGVDCVVSGYELPAMDGLELLERVRDEHPELPFVVFATDGSEAVASRAISTGATDYLPVPDGEAYDRLTAVVSEAIADGTGEDRFEPVLEATAALQGADTREAVAERAIACVSDGFDLPLAICWFHDPGSERLEPASASHAAREAGVVSDLSSEENEYEAFRTAEVTTYTGEEVTAAPGEEGLLVPLGDRGLLAAGRREPAGPVEELSKPAGVLADHVERALSRVERTRERREREQYLRVIAEHIDEAISLMTPDYSEVLYASPAYEEIWGRPVEELYEDPTSYVDGIDPRDREKVRAGNERILEDFERGEFGREYWIEFRVRRPNGEVRWIYSTGTAVELPDGEVGFVASATDITERKRHEQRLEVFNRVLRHNLRNQLDVIRSHAEALADRTDDDHADTILATTDSLARTGNRAREIDRLMSRETREETVDLAAVLRETVSTTEHPAEGVDVTVDAPDTATLVTDGAILETVLESALENAVTYADSSVTVAVEGSPRGWTVTVADDGPGIPTEEVGSLDAGSETDLRHGRGLGLWQLKWGVEKLTGELSFDHRDGTTVHVIVPDLGG